MKGKSLFIIVLFLIVLMTAMFLLKTFRKITTSIKAEEKKVRSVDSLQNQKYPASVNAINMPEIELPYISNLISTDSRDTLDFDLSGTEENMIFKIFVRGKTKDTLILKEAVSFELYEEGDVNGDGITDIGFLPGYSTSACRNYEILTFRKNKIKTLFDISTHLPDREKGVDYVKREGNRIRIIQAVDGCCQCFGLGTTYIKIAK